MNILFASKLLIFFSMICCCCFKVMSYLVLSDAWKKPYIQIQTSISRCFYIKTLRIHDQWKCISILFIFILHTFWGHTILSAKPHVKYIKLIDFLPRDPSNSNVHAIFVSFFFFYNNFVNNCILIRTSDFDLEDIYTHMHTHHHENRMRNRMKRRRSSIHISRPSTRPWRTLCLFFLPKRMCHEEEESRYLAYVCMYLPTVHQVRPYIYIILLLNVYIP